MNASALYPSRSRLVAGVLIALALVVGLAACGKKGPLYLPDSSATTSEKPERQAEPGPAVPGQY